MNQLLSHSFVLLGVLVMLTVRAAAVASEPLLKSDDRVVFFGDSITEQKLYSRMVQQYIYCRHPDWDIRSYNAGWNGDSTPGGLARMQRDVLSLGPTVVTVFFGMNDAGYKPATEASLASYRKSLDAIVTGLAAKGIRVIVFTPTCIDGDKDPNLAAVDYNKALEAFAAVALDVARERQCVGVDLFHAMLKLQTELKARDPSFTLSNDGIHPSPAGHEAIAGWMLKGLGIEPMRPVGTVDLASGTAEGLRVVSQTDDKIVLESTEPTPVPYFFESTSQPLVEASGFMDLAGQRVTVRGLKPGYYTLATAGGYALGNFSSAALAAGVAMPGHWSDAARHLKDVVIRKEANYYTAWREVRLQLADAPQTKQIVDALMAADDGFHAMLHGMARPTQRLKLTLTPAPEGPNLALHRKYETSNPNQHGWGAGGLTDGTVGNAFMTDDSNVFPKQVTIDLGAESPIDLVAAAVPNQGSTRTIVAAVSADGTMFTEVGRYVFQQRKSERHLYHFAPVTARYVRLIYPDHYPEMADYLVNYVFTTECEVYNTQWSAK